MNLKFFTALHDLITAPRRERDNAERRRVQVIRVMAKFSDIAGATAVANRAIVENWTVDKFETELAKLK